MKPAFHAFILAALSLPVLSATADSSSQPNILMIVADDLGFSDLGCYGGEIETPNLDRLASEGVRFTQFYNCAVCNATRIAMLTGRHPRWGKPTLWRDGMVTAAELLRSAGYATAMSGKWHLGGSPTRPIDRGFDDYYGVMIGAVNYFDPNLPDPPGLKHSGPPQPFVHNGQPVPAVPADYYTTDAFTDHALNQIRSAAEQRKPFFLHLAYNAPHYPLQARPEDIAKYRGRYQAGYAKLRAQRHARLLELGLIPPDTPLPEPDTRQGDWRYDLQPENWENADQEWEAAKMEIYAAMVDRLDQNAGRVLDALHEHGLEQNTLVIFFSDNGGCASRSSEAARQAFHSGQSPGGKDSYILCGPGWATAQSSPFRRYKTWTHEGGITTPMIVRWPGKAKPGGVIRHVTHVVDLLPTFVEITGQNYPVSFNGKATLRLEGSSLVPVLTGARGLAPRELGWELYGSRAYRHGRWKIVWGVTTKRWELYDMINDRTETKDLAAEQPERLAKMTQAWERWTQRD